MSIKAYLESYEYRKELFQKKIDKINMKDILFKESKLKTYKKKMKL